MASLPPVIPVSTLAGWLPEIFGEGTANRNYVIREMAAKTLFVMLYVGAVEGAGRCLRPDQVTKMTDRQAAKTDARSREKWARDSVAPGRMRNVPGRWYAPNTREPIRDETLRSGLVSLGAITDRRDLPTTSARPRYAVAREFADLLIQLFAGAVESATLIGQWQARHLTPAALSRISLLREGTVRSKSSQRVRITFPNGETRLMLPGPSTIISRAVVEGFSRRFLREPGVIFLSESGHKVVERDEALANSIGLRLDYSRNLPDIILADVCLDAPKVVFAEVVATDGAITEQRKQALLRIAEDAGYQPSNIFFVSAFLDRSTPAFRKLVSEIAWSTFAWFVAEPDKLLAFREGQTTEHFSLRTVAASPQQLSDWGELKKHAVRRPCAHNVVRLRCG